LDTDISSDVDDVGAVSVLHQLANQGEIEILAVMVSSGDPWSARCLHALNTYLGRSGIPVGAVYGKSVVHESKYTQKVATEFGHDIDPDVGTKDAISLYREILTSRNDGEVTIISVGYLTNLSDLLQSTPDAISSLGGRNLVAKKVNRLVCMGGKYPSGREWNFYQDASSAAYTVKTWPSPIVFVGFETGVKILTGSGLINTTAPNPVRRAYELYNGLTNRPSWDQLAVLYAAKNDQPSFAEYWEVITGKNSVQDDGSNHWVETSALQYSYVRLKKPPGEFAEMIENLMIQSLVPRLK